MLVATWFLDRGRAGGRRVRARAAWALVAIGLAAIASPAAAQEISLRTTLAERLQYDDNIRLEPNPPGGVFGSATSIDATAERRTPRAAVAVNFGADYHHFTGAGATSDLNSLDWNTALGGETRTARATLGGRVGYSRAAVRETELLDSGVTGGDTERATASASGNFSYLQTSRDTLGAEVLLEDVTFKGDDSAQRNPFRSADVTLSWMRELTPRQSGGLIAGFGFSETDDLVETTGRTLSGGVRYEDRRSPRLTFTGEASVGVAIEEQNNTERGVTTRESESAPTLEFDVGLTYVLARSRVSLGFGQEVEATARGGLQQVRTVSAGYSYELTPMVLWNVKGDLVSHNESIKVLPFGGADRTFTAVETQLRWRFVPQWTLAGGYRFRYDDDFDGTATSNAVFAILSYSFTPLP